MRSVHRKDTLQTEIVMGLRKAGAKVKITSALGEGFPDLICLFRGTLSLLEVKSKGGRLTQDEIDFYNDWQEVTTVVYNLDDALKVIGAI